MLEKTLPWRLIPVNKPLMPERLTGANSEALVNLKHALK